MVNLYTLAALVAVVPHLAYSALLPDGDYRILTSEGFGLVLPGPNRACIIAFPSGAGREQVWTVRSVPGDDDIVLENDEYSGYYAAYESAQPEESIIGTNSRRSTFTLRPNEAPNMFYIDAKGGPSSIPLTVAPLSPDSHSEVQLSFDQHPWLFAPVGK